ncbi:MAG: hypothetical protein FJ295_16975, partial [Planctomycetes bacterium]|nr:hypothetical protein [Planctomycetota bacterium]
MIRIATALTIALGLACIAPIGADEPGAKEMYWKLSGDFRGQETMVNPLFDRDQEPVWHLLRTTGMEGPVESRQWLRDGKYVPLTEKGEKLFASPIAGWAYRPGQSLSPLVSRVMADYDLGLKFDLGDIMIAPGPEHAVVIGWRSPVAGTLEIQGQFEHAQNCCGVNSQIQWYVERGPAPDEKNGFQPLALASGRADFGSATPVGPFQIKDQPIQP